MGLPELTPLFRHGGGALMRAAAVPLTQTPGWWPPLADPAACRRWLEQAWHLPGFAEAVRHASAGLADRVADILAEGVCSDSDVGRAAAAVMRYLLRATGRPTPFGLFAGVAAVTVGHAASVRWRDAHRCTARVDTQWLAAVIGRLETSPELLDRLDVVFNDLAVRRGGRLEAPQGPDRVTVRYTAAVHAARDGAASPVRFGVLADKVSESFPSAGRAVVRAMLTSLVHQGLLITSLRAPCTVIDPLGHLVTRLHAADALTLPSVQALCRDVEAVRRQVQRHNDEGLTDGERARLRASLVGHMQVLSTAGRTPLAVDLLLDAEVQVPTAVVAEMEQAASVLLRLTRRPTGEPAWHAFHAAFRDRYGTGALVPVTEVVNPDAGLGYPAGYPGSVLPTPVNAPTERDELLLALAWQAVADGSHEITLTPDTIDALTGDGFDERCIPAHLELAARIHAATTEALTGGEFTLTVAPARSAGTLTSRFTPTATGTGLEELYVAVPPTVEGALPVQMSFPPMYPHAENVCRVPAYLPHVLPLGEHRSNPTPAVITVDDLAIVATRDRLHLLSMSRRRVVDPQVFHALALQKQPPPLARFLAHLTRSFCATWHEFDWGPHAHRLPYLPRVRYRRTIISPARWRLTTRDLPAPGSTLEQWCAALLRWRHRWHCPDTIELRNADRTLRMTLTEPTHLGHLRAHLDRHGEAALTEAAAAAELGWLAGHAHEIAIPLVRTGPTAPSPQLDRFPQVSNRDPGHLPGSPQSRWLYAKVYTHPERMDEIITAYLPRLLAVPDGEPACWFVRYRSPHDTDHLRLRIHIPDPEQYPACAAAIGSWAQHLREAGTIHRLVLDTYHPEVGRYGTGDAMLAAEAVFAADSHLVSTALRLLPATTIHPVALTAINMVDIVEGLLGSRAEAMSWLIDRPIAATPIERAVAAQAVRWAIDGTLPNAAEWPAAVAAARRARAAALATYRQQLPDATDTEAILVSLLHMHHNRALGIDPDREATCRRLCRQTALAWRASQGSGDR